MEGTARVFARGARTSLFDDSGRALAQLQVQRIALEYQKRGFLRVAWQREIVLEGLSLVAGFSGAWTSGGAQMLATLQQLAQSQTPFLRDSRIADPAGWSISVRQGRLRADGSIDLAEATLTDASHPNGVRITRFQLSGPGAGTWTTASSTASARGEPSSPASSRNAVASATPSPP